MKVKICGLTTLEDALAAVEAGADLLGFNFYPKSPRCLAPEACRAITAGLRRAGADVVTVGVFVNAGLEEITAILDSCSLDLAQLHGDEPPELLAQLGSRAFKALRPDGSEALEALRKTYPPRADAPAYLVDAFQAGSYGGTGRTGDWLLAGALAAGHPILLAGGLTSENVAAAVKQVHPWGVDTASGVETSPGRKDRLKMEAFIRVAKNLPKELG